MYFSGLYLVGLWFIKFAYLFLVKLSVFDKAKIRQKVFNNSYIKKNIIYINISTFFKELSGYRVLAGMTSGSRTRPTTGTTGTSSAWSRRRALATYFTLRRSGNGCCFFCCCCCCSCFLLLFLLLYSFTSRKSGIGCWCFCCCSCCCCCCCCSCFC